MVSGRHGPVHPDRFTGRGDDNETGRGQAGRRCSTRLRGLYAITPDCSDGRRLLADVEAALAGGCRIVQYRDKISNKPEQLARAKALRI